MAMFQSVWSRVVGAALCGTMFVLLLKYLFDTYSRSSIIVALISTALVVVTGLVPYAVQRWRCARAARTSASGETSQASPQPPN
jgi:endonuclease/exonuclease/phosphatase (EEP) superfamily protein YafD